MGEKTNDLTEIITQAINEIKIELGDKFNPDRINLAELERRTGISRAKLRRLKKNGFVDLPHGLTGRKAERTVLTGFTGVIDSLLTKGITNSSVCFDRLKEAGYQGGLTAVKTYMARRSKGASFFNGIKHINIKSISGGDVVCSKKPMLLLHRWKAFQLRTNSVLP